jgi:hypothetical protein
MPSLKALTQKLDNPQQIEKRQYTTGAVRSKDADDVRLDLLCPAFLLALARVFAEGAKKYGEGNWQKGMPAAETLNHAMRHLEMLRMGDISEDHLAHAAANLMMLIHFQQKCACGTWPDRARFIDDQYQAERVAQSNHEHK